MNALHIAGELFAVGVAAFVSWRALEAAANWLDGHRLTAPGMEPFRALGMDVDGNVASRIELSAGMGPDFSLRVFERRGEWVVYVSGLTSSESVRRTRWRWRAVRWCRAALRDCVYERGVQ
jgi:hypothetical protein